MRERKFKARRLTQEEEESIVSSYLDGLTSPQIAKNLKCENATVLKYLHRAGVKVGGVKDEILPEYLEKVGEKELKKCPSKEEILKRFIYDRDKGILINKRTLIEPKPNKRGYTDIQFLKRGDLRVRYKMHRLIFFLETVEEPDEVDHIDGNPRNNHFSNLRSSTRTLNSMNRPKPNRVTNSKYKGVRMPSDKKKWSARINVNGKEIHLGYFDEEDHAALAYNEAALEHFGDHAWLNKIGEEINDNN